MMKDPEKEIEKVLEGLRNTSAPLGMDRRIMEALEARASARSRWGWHRLTLASIHPGATGVMKWSVGLAVVCAVVLTVTANRWFTHVGPSSKKISNSVATLPVVASEAATNSSQITPLRPGVRRRKAANPERTVRAGEAGVADGSDSLALEEMRAASQPPPPMPLTDQEKLLLRIARKGDPVEVAELDPIVRAARYEREKAAVQRFFKPAAPGDNE